MEALHFFVHRSHILELAVGVALEPHGPRPLWRFAGNVSSFFMNHLCFPTMSMHRQQVQIKEEGGRTAPRRAKRRPRSPSEIFVHSSPHQGCYRKTAENVFTGWLGAIIWCCHLCFQASFRSALSYAIITGGTFSSCCFWHHFWDIDGQGHPEAFGIETKCGNLGRCLTVTRRVL